MRRFAIGSAMVLALVLMLAAIAVAGPPTGLWCDDENGPGTRPDHPSCATTTTPIPTTPEPPVLQPCASVTTLVDGVTNLFCDWTPMPGSEIGTVTVTVDSGEIGGLAIWVLDSLPGNICVLEQINKPTNEESASFNLAEGETTYWNTGGSDWCAQYDVYGPKNDLNGEPLYVRVQFRAKKNTVVEISLTPDQDFSE